MQVEAQLTPTFTWNDRVLGKGGAQAFWITIENIDENRIIHHERLSLNKKKVDPQFQFGYSSKNFKRFFIGFVIYEN